MVHGQLESAWPVAGSVLLRDGTIFAAAGRAPDADGGVSLVALDARSGEEQWSRTVDHDVFGLSDLLVGDSDHVYFANWQFDPTSGSGQPLKDKATKHLRGGKVGLLEGAWTRIDLSLRKEMQDWNAWGNSGQLLAFTATASNSQDPQREVCGFRLSESGQAELFSTAPRWQRPLEQPRQVHALVIAGDKLVIAGADRGDSSSCFLSLLSRQNGRVLHEMALPAEPVFDALAVAGERIYISLQSGEVMCLGQQR